MRGRSGIVAVVFLAMALASGAPAFGQPPAAVDVRLTEWSVGFPRITVKGPLVQFNVRNAGKFPHSFRIQWQAGGKTFSAATRVLQKGEKAALVVSLPPGTYKAYCYVRGHEERGMKGQVIVEKAAAKKPPPARKRRPAYY